MSNKTQFYQQCHLTRYKDEFGKIKIDMVVFLPKEFIDSLEPGEIFKIKQNDGTWENGWRIINAFHPFPAALVERNERDYLRQRETSDI